MVPVPSATSPLVELLIFSFLSMDLQRKLFNLITMLLDTQLFLPSGHSAGIKPHGNIQPKKLFKML
jgi:hypothetical protein